MDKRIAPRQNFIYTYQKVIDDLNDLCVDLKLALKDNTGVPATKHRLAGLQTRIMTALAGMEYKKPVSKTPAFFGRLETALVGFKPVPFTIKQIDEWHWPIHYLLEEFKTSSGPKY